MRDADDSDLYNADVFYFSDDEWVTNFVEFLTWAEKFHVTYGVRYLPEGAIRISWRQQ